MSPPSPRAMLSRLRRRQRSTATGDMLPDPSVPPRNRGPWDTAALINTDITELVKREIHTKTSPQQK